MFHREFTKINIYGNSYQNVSITPLFLQPSVPYPAIFWECQFFDEVSEEKNHCVAGESAGVLENFGYFTFWTAQNITLVVNCLFLN